MTKLSTDHLIGPPLDWAVAKCQGFSYAGHAEARKKWVRGIAPPNWSPSTDWSQGGPIIEREIGNLWKDNKLSDSDPDLWTAASYRKTEYGTSVAYQGGPTPLIAAMRCYVASKLGATVEVPDAVFSGYPS